MAIETLTVALRGTRDYVQGSQILARTAELIAAASDTPATLVTAKFTQITDRGVIVALADTDAPDGVEIGRAQFVNGAERQTVRYFEVAGPQAPWIEDVAKVTTGLVAATDGTGQADFAIAGTFESYLVAIIECVKAVHDRRGDQVSDIWFTALMGARLPIASVYPTTGVLRVTPKIERMVDGRLQTLSLLETESATGAPPPFQICFSCVVGT